MVVLKWPTVILRWLRYLTKFYNAAIILLQLNRLSSMFVLLIDWYKDANIQKTESNIQTKSFEKNQCLTPRKDTRNPKTEEQPGSCINQWTRLKSKIQVIQDPIERSKICTYWWPSFVGKVSYKSFWAVLNTLQDCSILGCSYSY